jgi:flagellar hook protein FlgE
MLRSLFTGISGLSAHQQMLDVTANNIANVNTTGFKSSRAAFQDTLSQTIQGASAARPDPANADRPLAGGTNAIQIGLGVKLAGTEMNMGQGSAQSTGVATDLMINGDGFFTVIKDGALTYTRSGAFHLDNDGQLVTSDGAVVAGVAAPGGTLDPQPATAADVVRLDLSPLLNGYTDAGGPIYGAPGTPDGQYVSYTIDQSGAIKAVRQSGEIDTLGQITMANFPNPNGLQKVGASQCSTPPGSGDPVLDGPGAGWNGSVASGFLEMSNVDLSAELTNLIIAQRGFQANSKSITTSDQILQTLVSLKQ